MCAPSKAINIILSQFSVFLKRAYSQNQRDDRVYEAQFTSGHAALVAVVLRTRCRARRNVRPSHHVQLRLESVSLRALSAAPRLLHFLTRMLAARALLFVSRL